MRRSANSDSNLVCQKRYASFNPATISGVNAPSTVLALSWFWSSRATRFSSSITFSCRSEKPIRFSATALGPSPIRCRSVDNRSCSLSAGRVTTATDMTNLLGYRADRGRLGKGVSFRFKGLLNSVKEPPEPIAGTVNCLDCFLLHLFCSAELGNQIKAIAHVIHIFHRMDREKRQVRGLQTIQFGYQLVLGLARLRLQALTF